MSVTITEKMLINATQLEEIRVALIKGTQLFDLDIERPADIKKKSNIYKCRITRIEPSLEAVFVEYGAKRQGFLPVKEIAQEYHLKKPDGEGNFNIREALREGQELMVQVDKEERGNKGAALTTFITLAGCYLVLMPNNPSSGGISRRIEGDEREELRDTIQNLGVPEGMGLIIRTAGVGKNEEDLKWDLDILLNQWKAIQAAYERQPAPFLIYQEGDVIIRSIRDNLRRSISEIIIDDHIAYAKAKNYIEQVKPDFLQHLKLYNDHVPLFSRYQIEGQIEDAYQRAVLLPSGGALVIDRTEALVAIDINSAKSTAGIDIENTALNTNLEAADEIARQLRLRDLGGLIVIDFIDMSNSRNQRDVENRLREALTSDRAKIQIGRISRFGLLEMSRQRLRLSLNESIQETCPHCEGKGVLRRPQSQALSLIRLIEEEASKDDGLELQIQLPIEIATFLLNEKRSILTAIEKRHNASLLVIPNPHMRSVQYKISRIRKEDRSKASFEQIALPELNVVQTENIEKLIEQPAVQSMTTSVRPSEKQKEMLQSIVKNTTAYIKRLWNSIFSAEEETSGTEKSENMPENKENNASRGVRRTPHQNRSRNSNYNSGQQQRRRPPQQRTQSAERVERSERQERAERPEKTERTERSDQGVQGQRRQISSRSRSPSNTRTATSRTPRAPREDTSSSEEV